MPDLQELQQHSSRHNPCKRGREIDAIVGFRGKFGLDLLLVYRVADQSLYPRIEMAQEVLVCHGHECTFMLHA